MTIKDRAGHHKGKRLESTWKIDGNQKCLNSKKGKEKELVDRKRALTGKLEELYLGEEQETFKEEAKQ